MSAPTRPDVPYTAKNVTVSAPDAKPAPMTDPTNTAHTDRTPFPTSGTPFGQNYEYI
jgi:hypothetical protein